MINLGGGMGGIIGNLASEALGAGEDSPLKKVLGTVAGSSGKSENDVLGSVMSMVQKSGGIGSVIEMLGKNGMESQARSWVGNNANEEIQPGQVEQALGGNFVKGVAEKLGVKSTVAQTVIAAVLPELINQITPGGDTDGEQDSLIEKGLSLLGGF
ncbi:hypothetical protein CSA37_08660 [Candidatus Fermentibacteria bacterium]|nr:MAG: hypothetical protein CSA37_08660 [Candidatus Fermentibacteria bacterium]